MSVDPLVTDKGEAVERNNISRNRPSRPLRADQPLGQRPGGHHIRRKQRQTARHREPDRLLSVRNGGAGEEL